MSIFKSVPDHDLIFEISGIDEDEYQAIVNSNLFLQDLKEGDDYIASNPGYPLTTCMCKVLTGERHAGKLFVGGLYVTTSKYAKYGYDFAPELVKLDRDRGFIDGIDLQFLTAKVISATGNVSLIEDARNLWDGSYFKYYLSNYRTILTVSLIQRCLIKAIRRFWISTDRMLFQSAIVTISIVYQGMGFIQCLLKRRIFSSTQAAACIIRLLILKMNLTLANWRTSSRTGLLALVLIMILMNTIMVPVLWATLLSS